MQIKRALTTTALALVLAGGGATAASANDTDGGGLYWGGQSVKPVADSGFQFTDIVTWPWPNKR